MNQNSVVETMLIELKSDMNVGFEKINAKFEIIAPEIMRIGTLVDKQIIPDIKLLKTDVTQVKTDVARVEILVEEQNSRNKTVLEGLSGLYHRQDRIEKRTDEFERLVKDLTRTKT